MLRNSVLNSLSQILDIIHLVHSLPESTAIEFYRDKNAGKHIRHVLDHFYAFLPAQQTGILDYNLRNRESVVEKDWVAAKTQLLDVIEKLKVLPINDKDLSVISEIDVSDTQNEICQSNIRRELLYLINHTIHHAAYIKLLAQICEITLPAHIGIAPSTASYLRKIEAN